jgi:hypothetical protein
MPHQNSHEDADYPWTPDKKSGCFVATIAGGSLRSNQGSRQVACVQ